MERDPAVVVAPPWDEPLRLAWEAYRHDSVPVGATICDASGTVVARGRNRMHEVAGAGDDGIGLSGSRLAHAEVNALLTLGLTTRGDFGQHTLYSTTEPCLLCAGAITMAKIGAVRYAATEPVAGSAHALTTGTPYVHDLRIDVVGPDHGVVGAFARLLHEEWAWRRSPHGLVEMTTRAVAPALAEIVADVVRRRIVPEIAARGATVEVVLDALADDVDRVRDVVGG